MAATFIIKRLADDWKLLLGILFGITVATGLIAGAPVYVQALERQGINTAIDSPGNLTGVMRLVNNDATCNKLSSVSDRREIET